MIDLLKGGQGVFGIALGGVWKDIEGSLAALPVERVDEPAGDAETEAILDRADDELSRRRKARAVS